MIKKAGGESVFFKVDISKSAEVQAMINKAVELYGRLDIAFNNAGIEGPSGGNFYDYTEEAFDRVTGINLKGVFLCLKYELPVMIKQGKGAIVNTSSIAGLVGFPGMPGYSASKFGVIGDDQSLRRCSIQNRGVSHQCRLPGSDPHAHDRPPDR